MLDKDIMKAKALEFNKIGLLEKALMGGAIFCYALSHLVYKPIQVLTLLSILGNVGYLILGFTA